MNTRIKRDDGPWREQSTQARCMHGDCGFVSTTSAETDAGRQTLIRQAQAHMRACEGQVILETLTREQVPRR